MVQRYRKKPVVIEAMRLTVDNAFAVLEWVGGDTLFLEQTWDNGVVIQTFEGPLLARYGDYVIKGVKGEFYPCKPDIFEATYDPVEEEAVRH